MNKKTFLKRAAWTLVIALSAPTLWAYEGSGTSDSPWLIQSKADMNQFATDVNGGNNFSGKYFKLTCDLAYSAEETYKVASCRQSLSVM